MSAANRPDILEGHIDILLEDAFRRHPGFAAKFAMAAGAAPKFDLVSVNRQERHTGTTGTADLVVTYRLGSQPVLQLLIENKLDAAFTQAQPQRYGQSRDARRRAGHAGAVLTVLACPSIYASASRHAAGFDATVTYEAIMDWLDDAGRAKISDAILKARTPYEALDVPEVSDFFDGLQRLAVAEFPELVIKLNPNVDGARPEASRTIYFHVGRTLISHPGTPTLRFSLQCWDSGAPSASAKIMLAGWAAHLAKLQRAAARDLAGTGFYIRAAGASLGIVADTPRLDNKRPIERQLDAVRSALSTATRLARWWNEAGSVVAGWLPITQPVGSHREPGK